MPDRKLPMSGEDVRNVQNVGIMDKFKMVRQGLDPQNPDHINRYRAGGQNMNQGGMVQGYAQGGMVPNMAPPPAPGQPGTQPPQTQTQPMTEMDDQKQMQMDALRKLRGF